MTSTQLMILAYIFRSSARNLTVTPASHSISAISVIYIYITNVELPLPPPALSRRKCRSSDVSRLAYRFTSQCHAAGSIRKTSTEVERHRRDTIICCRVAIQPEFHEQIYRGELTQGRRRVGWTAFTSVMIHATGWDLGASSHRHE